MSDHARRILERLLPYLEQVNHIHLDDKRSGGNILYASEVAAALDEDSKPPDKKTKTIELDEERFTALLYFLGVAQGTLEDDQPAAKAQMWKLINVLPGWDK
jgi:hypothetical protein